MSQQRPEVTVENVADPVSKSLAAVERDAGSLHPGNQLLCPSGGAASDEEDGVVEANITRRLSAVFEAIEEDKKDQASENYLWVLTKNQALYYIISTQLDFFSFK